MRIFLSISLSLVFLTSSLSVQAQTHARLERLLSLQERAKAYQEASSLSKENLYQLLTLISGTLLMAQMKHFSQQQLSLALAQEFQKPPVKPFSSAPALPKPSSYMMAKKAPTADPNQLSLFPPEVTHQTPRPKPVDRDLSWLDAPREPLRPTKIDGNGYLFDQPELRSAPKKTYLAKRVEQEYGHTPLFQRLTLEEREGLFQRLNQAAGINHKLGREAAEDFLFKMQVKFPQTRILFLGARKFLLTTAFLVGFNFIAQAAQQENDDMFVRLMQNPSLFLDASKKDLAALAQNPHAVEYAEILVQGLEEIQKTSFSEQQIQEIQKNHSSKTTPSHDKYIY